MEENRGQTNEQAGGAVDSEGTSQGEARAMLTKLRDNGFEGSDEKLAVALGRPVEQVAAWTNGSEPVDDDVAMKARGIAQDRSIAID